MTWLDSGADQCVFPLSFARLLGIDVSGLPQTLTGGVGSSANVTYFAAITIDLGSEIKFHTLAGFTAGLEAQGVGLLGQIGFFENFQVRFDHRRLTFSIDPA
jgi:hypothetical protein